MRKSGCAYTNVLVQYLYLFLQFTCVEASLTLQYVACERKEFNIVAQTKVRERKNNEEVARAKKGLKSDSAETD